MVLVDFKWNLTKKKRRDEKVKYLVFGEFCGENVDKVTEIAQKLREARKKNPEKYPEILFPSHSMIGDYKVFTVVEATKEQMINLRLPYGPLMKFKYVPIVKATEMTEAAQKIRE